jgi:hypothetical protein
MIYLASPYSQPDPAARQRRFGAACQGAATLLRAGKPVFAPVIHGHPVVAYGLPTDWEFWEPINRRLLVQCSQVAVLMLDAWRVSVGVQAEIRIARELGKPVG